MPEHTFWTLPQERRLQRLVVELREAGAILDVTQRAHRLLVVDLLFLFALGLLGACRFVSSTALADPQEALLSYLLGGPEQKRARRNQLAQFKAALEPIGEAVPTEVLSAVSVEPPYFDALAETVTRFLRRPRDAQRILRFLEWWSQVQIGLDGPAATQLGPGYAEVTRKLVSDLARTCFEASGLGAEWLRFADATGDGADHVVADGTDRPDTRPADAPAKSDAKQGQLKLP